MPPGSYIIVEGLLWLITSGILKYTFNQHCSHADMYGGCTTWPIHLYGSFTVALLLRGCLKTYRLQQLHIHFAYLAWPSLSAIFACTVAAWAVGAVYHVTLLY